MTLSTIPVSFKACSLRVPTICEAFTFSNASKAALVSITVDKVSCVISTIPIALPATLLDTSPTNPSTVSVALSTNANLIKFPLIKSLDKESVISIFPSPLDCGHQPNLPSIVLLLELSIEFPISLVRSRNSKRLSLISLLVCIY